MEYYATIGDGGEVLVCDDDKARCEKAKRYARMAHASPRVERVSVDVADLAFAAWAKREPFYLVEDEAIAA